MSSTTHLPPGAVSSLRSTRWLVVWALAAEVFLFTYGRNSFGPYASPVALLLCAAVACAGTYRYVRGAAWPPAGAVAPAGARRGALVLAWVLGLLMCFFTWRDMLRAFLVDINSSDIIPALSIYTKRFLAGEKVYTPFTAELGYYALPTYLPGTWFPYVLPEMLHLDYRWMSGLLLLVGLGAYSAVVLRLRQSFWLTFGLGWLPFFLVYTILITAPSTVGYTVEMMIVGYYLVLAAGLLLPSRGLRVVGLILILLSRYSLVLWLPLYLGLLFFQSRREALLTVGLVGLGVVGLYVVPFMSQDWGMFLRVINAYTDTAVGEWRHLNDDGLPYHLYNGIGMGAFFYRYGRGELLDSIVLLKRVHLLLLLTVVVGAALLYWRQARPRTDYRLFALLTLKLYLAVFYAFIQVPYDYLAFVGMFCSLPLVLMLFGVRPVGSPVLGPEAAAPMVDY